MLIQIPHGFLPPRRSGSVSRCLRPSDYAAAYLFMPREPVFRQDIERIWWETAREEGLKVLGWRDVPVDDSVLGSCARRSRSRASCSSAADRLIRDEAHFERKLFVAARWCPTA